MKKIIGVILLSLLSLMGCKKSDKPTLLVPGGSPLISVAGILDEFDAEVTAGPSLIPSEFIKGEKDIIIAPVIVGAKLHILGSSKYQLAAVIGFSNLHIASRTPLNSIDDLKGKTIHAFGEHATPGIVLKTVLKDQDTTIKWGNDVQEMMIPFNSGNAEYVLIAEPLLTVLRQKLTEDIYTLSLKDIFPTDIIQVGVFINPSSSINLDQTIKSIKSNIAYLKENPETYAHEIIDVHQQLTNLKETVIANAIPNLDLNYQPALTIKASIESFFQILNEANEELLKNKLPDQSFYYER